MAKDDFSEAERFPSSGSEVWFASLCPRTNAMRCASSCYYSSVLPSGSDCFVLGWGGVGVEQDNPRTVLP